ncbi:MAG: DNA polymerase I [Acetobacteraceae bacterium]|nr:DNA polymerase I [Acetobacteraceae bacterium]
MTPADIEAAVLEPPEAAGEQRLHLILIDGSGFIFRAYHALPPMTRSDGTPVNAVFGFTNMLAKLLREQVGTHIAVIFDAGKQTFRNRLYEDYKAHRPPPPDELMPQFPLVREAVDAFCVPAVELADWEADDLIASYAREAAEQGGQVTIVSSDKDLMQLIRPGVEMLDPIKQKPIGPAEVMERFGVPPDKMVEVQALIGDSSDNVPGVPGIGPKRAAELINEFGDVEGVLAAAPSMKPGKRRDILIENAANARLSRELVTLHDDAPLPVPIETLVACEPDRPRLTTWLRKMEFRSILARVTEGEAARPAPAPKVKAPEAPSDFGPYETVSDGEGLAHWVARARESGMLGLEVVTGGHELIGVALATAIGRACYVPLRHGGLVRQVSCAEAIELLGPVLSDPTVLKIFQDAKLQLDALTRAGFPLATPVDCATLICYAQEAGLHGHSLEELAQLHLSHTLQAADSVTGSGRGRLTFADVPVERVGAYAAERADATFRLWCAMRPRLRFAKALTLYEQVERRLIPVLLDMERAGVKVDAEELRLISKEFEVRMAAIEQQIHRLAGHEFNLGSTKQLGEVLFEEMKLTGGRRTKTGAYGTDASILQDLADQGHELPAMILEWRQLQKLKSTYADALIGEINPGTGRVHTSFAMTVTTTGRLSSNDPNLQNIPIRTDEGTRIRRAFIAAPGHVLVSADYSQIELRLLAHVADIPQLRESFIKGEDIHTRTASEVFGVPMAGMDGATRRRAKAINFGIIYGISPFGLGRQLGITPGEAKSYIDAYFERYPGIRAYMERTKEEARIQGYVLTPFGRRCWIPGIGEKNLQRRGYAERQAINAPLQGGAADVIKQAMVRLPRALADAGLRARLLLQVHDELLFEAPEEEADRLAEAVRGVMEQAVRLTVPLVVETGRGRTWAEAH